MNILEFIGSLQALPAPLAVFARNKLELVRLFNGEEVMSSVPPDVAQTRIPDRALDGYMAQQILADSAIEREVFVDYAFTATAIFAGQQVSVRSGYRERLLGEEAAYFVFSELDPCWQRIVVALDNVPIILNWWIQREENENDKIRIMRYAKFLNSRLKNDRAIEQVFQIFSCPSEIQEPKEMRILMGDNNRPVIAPTIGLLVLAKLPCVDQYIEAFRRLKPRLTKQAVTLIYGRRDIVNACIGELVLMHPWKGVALKHLAYQQVPQEDDYTILAFQADYIYCSEG